MNTTERRKAYTPEQLAAELEYRKRYQAENKDRLAQRTRDRRAAGKCKGTTHYRQKMTPEQRAAELAYKRAHYQSTREQQLAYAAQYRETNYERLREEWTGAYQRRKDYFDRYNAENKDRIGARRSKWKEEKREHVAAVQAAYLQRNLERHRAHQHNRKARKTQNGGRLSADIVERLYALQKGKCACCGKPLGRTYDLDHIVPIALGGANSDENVQLLTARCNRQKGATDPITFMQRRGRLL